MDLDEFDMRKYSSRPVSKGAKIGFALALASLIGVAHWSGANQQRRNAEDQSNLSQTMNVIENTMKIIGRTDNQRQIESSQEFLNYIGVNYRLNSNDIVYLEPSMANNWQAVYVNVKNKNADRAINPGFTTRSDLQSYINSGAK